MMVLVSALPFSSHVFSVCVCLQLVEEGSLLSPHGYREGRHLYPLSHVSAPIGLFSETRPCYKRPIWPNS